MAGKKAENRKLKIILTADGSQTIYHPEINDHYHSLHGALNESLHVYIRSGFSYHPSVNVSILEVGFGTGLNVLLTYTKALEEKRQVIYHSVDNFILPKYITDRLNYALYFESIDPRLFSIIHRLSWDEDHAISVFFQLRKIMADINEIQFASRYDIVYFDAFGPDKQPDMWTENIFRKIYNAMSPGGILTTYSSKGDVKRKLQKCGFIVEKIQGPPGKREMLRCIRKD